MSTLDRLRRLHQLRPQRTQPEPELSPAPPAPRQEMLNAPAAIKPQNVGEVGVDKLESKLESLVPGEVIENCNGTCYVVTERYPLHVQRGDQPLAHLLDHHPATFAGFHPAFGLQDATDFRQAVFLDTETTGLGGGAGVYCFMVGVGTFESMACGVRNAEDEIEPDLPVRTDFVVRQFFMRNPGEEGALLLALVELLDRYGMSVTFNGRTFDLPLLRTRLRQNQQIYPELRGSGRLLQPERPHLDLLHPARRLWKRRLQSCRLVNLEAEILGMQRSEEDVPGYLIPQLYTDYLHNGNAGELRRVFYHNREDIVSMVALAAQLSCLYEGTPPAQGETMHGLDWFSLGRCHEERGQVAEAERAYREALARLHSHAAQGDVFRQLGQLLKRQGRWDEAAALWQEWITTVSVIDATPYEELAKYCEWQCKDLEQAAMWTGWALHTLRRTPAQQQFAAHIADLERRLARLQRKQQGGG